MSISIGAFAVSERVFTTEACAAPGGVYTQTQGPELQLDVSALQRSVLLLKMSTLQGRELHLDVYAQQRSVLLLEVSTQQGPELEVSTLQGPELQLDVSALQCTAPEGVYTKGA